MYPPLPPMGRMSDSLPQSYDLNRAFDEKHVLRRHGPAPLRLDLPSPGWPPVSLLPRPMPLPSGGGAFRWLRGVFGKRAPRSAPVS